MYFNFNRINIEKSQIRYAQWALFFITIFSISIIFILYRFPLSDYNFYPQCILYKTTNLYCSGCGLTRGFDSFVKGDIISLFQNNLILGLLLPCLLFYFYSIIVQACRVYKPFTVTLSINDFYIAISFIFIYSIIRNIPFFEFLKPLPI